MPRAASLLALAATAWGKEDCCGLLVETVREQAGLIARLSTRLENVERQLADATRAAESGTNKALQADRQRQEVKMTWDGHQSSELPMEGPGASAPEAQGLPLQEM